MRRIVLRALVLIAGVSALAFADIYPVSTPQQISSTMATARPGDTLAMTPGTWTNAQIVFQGNGDSLRPIVLRAALPGKVLLTGTSNLRIAGTWLVVDGLRFENGLSPSGAVIEFRSPSGAESRRCRLTNTSVVNYNPADSLTDYKWVSLFGSHNRVDHCYLTGKRHSGTTLVVWLGPSPNHHLIDHNHFGPRPPLGINGGETIRVGTSDWSLYDSFTTVEENYFEECNGEIEIISSKSCGNVYRSNTFIRCSGALTLRHGNRCRVEGNYFFGGKVKDSGGIRVIGEDHVVVNNYLVDLDGSSLKSALPIMNGVPDSPLNRYFQVKRAVIAFNTLVNCSYNIIVGAGKDTERSLPPHDCTIANNIVKGSTAPLLQYEDIPVNLTYEGNLFHGASLGIPKPAGITIADPLLVKDSQGMWRPSAGSPALGAATGASFTHVTTDMDGQPRTGAFDIGADEASAAPVTRRPLTRADVGPEWMNPLTSIAADDPAVVQSPWLGQNFPNPFNPSTSIEYQIPRSSFVTLGIFDLLGREVSTLVREMKDAGRHSVQFDGSGLSSGVYLCRISAEGLVQTNRMILLK